jgi:cytoskeleton protein RodZ
VDRDVSAASVAAAPPVEAPRPSTPLASKPAESTPNSSVMHIDIEAKQAAWVAITDASGKRLMAKTLEANETHTLDLTAGATLRTGNAGGLVVRFNGKEIGPLGPVGKIRDISFKNGGYKVHAPDAG